MVAKNKKIEKEGTFQTIFFSVLIGLFTLGAIGFLIISNLEINQKRAELTSKIEALTEEMRLLKQENESLQAGIIQSETSDYWEEKAREQGYKKEGEKNVVIIPSEEKPEKSIEQEKSFLEKLWERISF